MFPMLVLELMSTMQQRLGELAKYPDLVVIILVNKLRFQPFQLFIMQSRSQGNFMKDVQVMAAAILSGFSPTNETSSYLIIANALIAKAISENNIPMLFL